MSDHEEQSVDEHLRADAGFCGCGLPREAGQALLAWLEKFGADGNFAPIGRNPTGDEYLMFYWLDHLGLTEHGFSLPGRLTPKGARLRDALRADRVALGREHAEAHQ